MARRQQRRKKKPKRSPRSVPVPKVYEAVGLKKKEALQQSLFKREQIKAKRMLKDYRSPFLLFHERKVPTGP